MASWKIQTRRATTVEEKRRFTRFEDHRTVSVALPPGKMLAGTLLNISEGGFQFKATRDWQDVGRVLLVLNVCGNRVEVPAIVLRSDADSGIISARFMERSSSRLPGLRRYLQANASLALRSA